MSEPYDHEGDTEELPVVMPRQPWWRAIDAAGVVAVVLSVALGASIISLALAAAIAEGSPNRELSQSAAALLSTTLGGTLGALSTYLGVSYTDKRRREQEKQQPPPDQEVTPP